MRRLVSFVALMAVPLMLCTGDLANAQKKGKDKDKMEDGDDKPAKEKQIKVGVVVGKVSAVYEDKRRLRLTVSYPVTSLDQGAAGQMAQAQQQMALAAARRDIAAMAQAQQQLAQAQARLYRTENKTKDVEIQAIDDVVVRAAKPKEAFDDKGKIKRFTKSELKELKGDKKQPGYKAEFGDLQVEQIVQVTIVRKKGDPAPKSAAPRPKKGKKGGDDMMPDVGADILNASMLMILREPPVGK